MLLRAAARVSPRGPSTVLRVATGQHQWQRSYARNDKPRGAVQKSPPHPRESGSQPATPNRPAENRTWSADKPVKFATEQQLENTARNTVLENESAPGAQPTTQQPIITPPPPSDTVELREPRHTTSSSTQTTTSENSAQQPIITPPPPAEEIPNQSGAEAAEARKAPTGPLPDLRQGIPSTFESEFINKSSSSQANEGESQSLDITEDSARPGGRGGRERPEDTYTSIDRRRNAMARYAYITFGALGLSAALYLGQNWSEAEAKLHPDAPNGWDPASFYARIKERLAPTLGYYTEPTFPKLLPEMDPAMRPSPYTLVLSLEDLLVSSSWNRQEGYKVAKRPGVDYFIRYMQQYYELVVFTTVQSMNADLVIRKLDPFRLISWPLYREATRYMNGEHVKDLSYLNRDLSKTLIIDTVPSHVQLQPENAIILPKWSGVPTDPKSNDLVALIPFLEYIASMSIDDVRKVLKSYEGKHIPTEFHRRETLAREAFNKKLAEEKSRKGGSVWGTLSNGLGMKPQLQVMPGGAGETLQHGKMFSDQVREQGLKNYEHIEREIQLHGEEWLKEAEKEEKKMQEESMKSMQSGMTGMFGGWFGGKPEGA